MTTWQPIDAAPKDGQAILGYVVKAEWDAGIDTVSPRRSFAPFVAALYWDRIEWRFVYDFETYASAEAAFWMPLPESPEAA